MKEMVHELPDYEEENPQRIRKHIITMLSILLPLIVVSIGMFIFIDEKEENEKREAMLCTVNQVDLRFSTVKEMELVRYYLVISNSDIQKAFKSDEALKIASVAASEVLLNDPNVDGLYIGDEEGAVSLLNHNEPFEGLNLNKSGWYYEAIATRQVNFTKPSFDSLKKEFGFIISSLLQEASEETSDKVLRMDVGFDVEESIVRAGKSLEPYYWNMMLMDEHGGLLLEKHKGIMHEDLCYSEKWREFSQTTYGVEEPGMHRYITINGETALIERTVFGFAILTVVKSD